MSRFVSRVFTTNDTWTAPAGVKFIMLIGCGGGEGGDGGNNYTSGFNNPGGKGIIPYLRSTAVTPNTSYAITIGAGGAGGAGGTSGGSGDLGDNGASTTFGSLATFSSVGLGQVELAFEGNTVTSGYQAITITHGTNSGSYFGGNIGNPGIGTGGAGGNGNNAGTGSVGTSAAANTGAGGGAGGDGSTAGGDGGAGGSGILTILWVE